MSADYYFDERVDRMKQYYEEAKELAAFYNECSAITTVPEVPVSNMFHVHFSVSKEKAEEVLADVYSETGVGLTGYVKEVDDTACSFEVSIGDQYRTVPKDRLQKVFQHLNERLSVCEIE
jgi:threonine aldolase